MAAAPPMSEINSRRFTASPSSTTSVSHDCAVHHGRLAHVRVSAESFASEVCDGILTHYKREEDAAMETGKLDEELSRMSQIVDKVKSNSLLLFNESFGSTNEREGSEIANQIVSALLDRNVKVFFVTHSSLFARCIGVIFAPGTVMASCLPRCCHYLGES
jgi:hypothetical protein